MIGCNVGDYRNVGFRITSYNVCYTKLLRKWTHPPTYDKTFNIQTFIKSV